MNKARDNILAQIRHALQRDELSLPKKLELKNRMDHSPRGTLPKLSADLVTLFIEKACDASAQVEKINSLQEVPGKIAHLFAGKNHPIALRIATDSMLTNLPWAHFPEVNIGMGFAHENDAVSLTTCLCGVAETGTVVLVSSPESPTTLNFLPETHIVLLAEKNIVGHYEDAWNLIRNHPLPRTVNFITGPSRTGDIEQTIQMGIHGPKQLYIFIYAEG